MTLEYILSNRTDGANPFKIFDAVCLFPNQEMIEWTIKRMNYQTFLKTSYWFAVSHTAKARAGMRCQVCNLPNKIAVHHRTYDTHGAEHRNMSDLTVLCESCHGLFHGHIESSPIEKVRQPKLPRGFTIPHGASPTIPDGETVVLTKSLIDAFRANGAFTNATLNAIGLKRSDITTGWPLRLVGRQISRQQYLSALDGRYVYREKLHK